MENEVNTKEELNPRKKEKAKYLIEKFKEIKNAECFKKPIHEIDFYYAVDDDINQQEIVISLFPWPNCIYVSIFIIYYYSLVDFHPQYENAIVELDEENFQLNLSDGREITGDWETIKKTILDYRFSS
jgi:hypothetical protein